MEKPTLLLWILLPFYAIAVFIAYIKLKVKANEDFNRAVRTVKKGSSHITFRTKDEMMSETIDEFINQIDRKYIISCKKHNDWDSDGDYLG